MKNELTGGAAHATWPPAMPLAESVEMGPKSPRSPRRKEELPVAFLAPVSGFRKSSLKWILGSTPATAQELSQSVKRKPDMMLAWRNLVES